MVWSGGGKSDKKVSQNAVAGGLWWCLQCHVSDCCKSGLQSYNETNPPSHRIKHSFNHHLPLHTLITSRVNDRGS